MTLRVIFVTVSEGAKVLWFQPSREVNAEISGDDGHRRLRETLLLVLV